jgi:hypothetical protein
MFKWLLVVVAGTIVLGLFAPVLKRMGLGRLPGDIVVRIGRRSVYLPITSTVVISLLLTVLLRVL